MTGQRQKMIKPRTTQNFILSFYLEIFLTKKVYFIFCRSNAKVKNKKIFIILLSKILDRAGSTFYDSQKKNKGNGKHTKNQKTVLLTENSHDKFWNNIAGPDLRGDHDVISDDGCKTYEPAIDFPIWIVQYIFARDKS